MKDHILIRDLQKEVKTKTERINILQNKLDLLPKRKKPFGLLVISVLSVLSVGLYSFYFVYEDVQKKTQIRRKHSL